MRHSTAGKFCMVVAALAVAIFACALAASPQSCPGPEDEKPAYGDTATLGTLEGTSAWLSKYSMRMQDVQSRLKRSQRRLQEVRGIYDALEDHWATKQEFGGWGAPDENMYIGEKNEIGERDGLGAVTMQSGDFYVGEWKRNMRHGVGKTITGYTIEEVEEMYLTEWRFDLPHGTGEYTTGDGLRYEGEWMAGRQDGVGVFSWPNETFFLGEWQLGKRHGTGIYENKEIKHEGYWLRGERAGVAKITRKDDKSFVYKLYEADKPVD